MGHFSIYYLKQTVNPRAAASPSSADGKISLQPRPPAATEPGPSIHPSGFPEVRGLSTTFPGELLTCPQADVEPCTQPTDPASFSDTCH